MAKKRQNSVGRDLSTLLSPPPVANRSRLPQTLRVSVSYKTNWTALGMVEDRRRWRPEPITSRPVVSVTVGRPARLVAKQNPRFNQPSQTRGIIAFAEPDRLPICVRRHQRREVLFAHGVGGSKNLRAPRRNQWSDISCK